jgi:cytochrome P450
MRDSWGLGGAMTVLDLGLMPDQGVAVPDLHDHLAALRAQGEVVSAPWNNMPVHVLTTYEAIREAFKDEELFSPRETRRVITPYSGERDISALEGAEHRLYRALVSGPFKRDAVEHLNANTIRPTVEELIDALPRGRSVDLVPSLCKPLPLTIIQRMLGIPPDPRLDDWADAFINTHQDPDASTQAATDFTELLGPIVDARRVDPQDDLISLVATAEIDGARLSDEDVFTFARTMFPAGADTTYMSTSNMLALLLSEPARWRHVVEDPESRPRAVEECLRLESPLVSMPRIARHDGAFRGVTIEEGSISLLCLASANREPSLYAEPDHYLPDRWLPGAKTTPIFTFGYAAHFCLGAPTARAEMLALLDVLVDRHPDLALEEQPAMLGSMMRRADHVVVALN